MKTIKIKKKILRKTLKSSNSFTKDQFYLIRNLIKRLKKSLKKNIGNKQKYSRKTAYLLLMI